MKTRALLLTGVLSATPAVALAARQATSTAAAAKPASAAAPPRFVLAHVGPDAVTQLYAPGAADLSPQEKQVAWHLTLAAHAGEEIAYDQLGWRLVSVKQLLEGVYLFGLEGKPGSAAAGSFDAKLTEYLLRFYGHTGNHDQVTSQKFVPAFTPAQLEAAALRAFAAGAPFGVSDEAGLKAWLKELGPTLFDAKFEPLVTSKAPPPGQDLLTASGNTAYGRDVKLKDLEGFQEKYPLNSRVVKVEGKLQERVFRTGTPDGKVAPGLYAQELGRVNAHLMNAAKSAPPAQAEALKRLVRYFQTGEAADWDAYNIAWLKADPMVDANLGFIETYVDARGQKGQWEALVNYRDVAENRVMQLIGSRAQYFEDRMPWPEKYRRKGVALPVAKAINLVDSYPQPPAGINLPNEQHIREKYGSKSVLVANVMETASAVKRLPLALEFSLTPEERKLAEKYSVTARKWLVAFHEVLGHASGQVDPKLQGASPSKFLKEYDNTLEEARADLVALYHAFDPALTELSPDAEAVARQMYRDFLVEGLTALERVKVGDAFEEDHQRGHHMTVSYLMQQGSVAQVKQGGRSYWVVKDFAKMREGVGELLGKLMVIKATGDYAGIRDLVQKYGVKFDPKLRDEVAARVKKAKVPTVLFMSSPRLQPVLGAEGAVVDLKVTHGQPFIEQHLERSLLGRLPPTDATRIAANLESSPAALRQAFRDLGWRPPKPVK
ncbi:peptidase [Aggregicoccus sp. 17bor-14]|uniref:dipeptidyl-peptidase 3 family protein n=1 Tax=Myxococcaceae TaxID=31 RepID=UPI00351A7003